MAAGIVRLRTKAERLRATDANTLRQMVLEFGAGRRISERAIGEIVASIDRETASASGWTFVMISAEANDNVIEWLFANSSRPQAAVRLWTKLFKHLRRDTGEVMQSREELAALVGITANHVSRIMSELEGIRAISRQRGADGVRYYMSPLAGTHLTGAARTKAQAQAPALKLVPAGE